MKDGSAHSGPRVLGIAGSPRRAGNSDRMLDAALDGARKAGADVARLVAADLDIGPCRGCNSCSRRGACAVTSDGMAEVYRALDEADALIVATPVYFASVPSTLKALYDRCQPYWARRYVLGEPPREHKRPAGLLLVGGGGDPFGPDCAVTTTRSVLAVLGAQLMGKVVADRVDARGEIEEHLDVLAACASLGARLTRDAANLS